MVDIELLVQRWSEQHSRVLPPASRSEVMAAFGSIGQSPTADVIRLYGHCGGMEVMDDALWRLWPLEEIVRENSEVGESGVLFGDYLICSWCYRLRPVTADVSAVYLDYFDGSEPVQVAPSLEKFFEALWCSPDDVLEPTWERRSE